MEEHVACLKETCQYGNCFITDKKTANFQMLNLLPISAIKGYFMYTKITY